MSTEFRTRSTDELAFVRFCKTAPDGETTSFEFGTVSNFEAVCQAADAGDTFDGDQGPLDSDPEFTRASFEAMVASGRATFGVFCATVALGSGDFFQFTVER
jgi:hypothetical protein